MAQDIAAVLGQFERKDGFLESKEYILSWAFGHLVELAEPQDYDVKYAHWKLDDLPILPENFELKALVSGKKQLQILQKLLNSSEVSETVNACDAGREGELIFRRIYKFCHCSKPIRRLWLSEATPSAIRKAFQNLRDGKEMENLEAAAEARSMADWVVGINATRAFSVRHNSRLSAGRVQTPTLALVVNREREIRCFKPVDYWEVWAELQTEKGAQYQAKWMGVEQGRLFQWQEAENILNKIKAVGSGTVIEVEQKETKEQPPLLFNLNDLQKEANKKYGLTAQKTLDTAQALYEKHKLLTYPRTDSRHLTEAVAQETIEERLQALRYAAEYKPLITDDKRPLTKRHVNSSKVSDHHALIPTAVQPHLDRLSPSEKQVYDLVVRRFLAIFYPDARYAMTQVNTEVNGENLISKGRVELEAGWKAVYQDVAHKDDQETEEQQLPQLTKGEAVSVVKAEAPAKQTKPPKHYTEAGLLAAMESAGRLVEDKELAGCLKDVGGIGTPATRAAIIERLIQVQYMERQKKNLLPTKKGETLIDLVPEQLKSVEMTALWEEGLRQIEAGQENAEKWMQEIRKLIWEVVQLAKDQVSQNIDSAEKATIGKCPLCGKPVVEGKKGYGCSGYKEGCKFVIWKEIAGKKLTESQAKTLLEKGSTGVLKGFKSKAGNTFEAALKINQEGKVEFVFAERKNESIGKCPLCGKEVVESQKGYGCSGYKEGCNFVIWKEIAGKKLTEKQARTLLQNGETSMIKGFKSKAGKTFEAVLVLQDGKIQFEFGGR